MSAFRRTSVDIMDQTDKSYELRERSKDATVQLSEVNEVDGINEETHGSHAPAPAAIDSQVRIRRLFSFTQIFMFSLTYMGLWEGMCT